MSLVRENIEHFERKGIKKTLDIGKYDENYDWENPQVGDMIELQEDMYQLHHEFNNIFGNYLTLTDLSQKLPKVSVKAGSIFAFKNNLKKNWPRTDDNAWICLDNDDIWIQVGQFNHNNRKSFKKLKNH